MLNTEKQITLQLDPTTDTTGNAEQVARMIGVSAWHISGDYLVVENPLLDYRVTNNETYSHKTDRIPNGAVVILVQEEEPKTVEQQIEQEIQSKNLNAPRLTPDHIDSKIALEMYFTGSGIIDAQTHGHHLGLVRFQHHDCEDLHKPMETLTFCVLVLENGFTVTGESACASPENFDAEIGRKIAYENARNKIWMLEGYLLKEKLYQQPVHEVLKSDPSNVKSFEPEYDNQVHSVGGDCIHRSKLLNNRENAYLLTQLLTTTNISNDLREKAETKMTALLDELI